MYSLESPHRGVPNENTQYTFMLQKINEILIKSPDLALLSTLTGSNYPSRTNFHGSKGVQAFEIRLYMVNYFIASSYLEH